MKAKSKAMGKAKSPPGPFAHLAHPARRVATRLGLWFLIEGAAADPRWLVYSRESGRLLMTYYVRSRHWLAGQDQGHCKGWRQALDRAARLANTALSH